MNPLLRIVILIAMLYGGWLLVITIRYNQRTARRSREIQQAAPELLFGADTTSAPALKLEVINGSKTAWNYAVFTVTPGEGVTLVKAAPGEEERISIPPGDLRWFGRPEKYHANYNEIWLHAALDQQWLLVKIRLMSHTMHALVRALKEIATDDQVTAYRRQRPYIHRGPVSAHPATQDIHGAWTLGDPVSLYLTPLFLVILRGQDVQRAVALDQVQQVSAIHRIDQPHAAGLVRFEVGDETVAFALRQHEAFAEALAEAAKRTLEDPVQWQRKKKKPDDLIDDEEFD